MQKKTKKKKTRGLDLLLQSSRGERHGLDEEDVYLTCGLAISDQV